MKIRDNSLVKMLGHEKERILASLFAGLAAIAGLYAVTGFTRAFIVTPINSFMLQFVPARAIANSIGGIVEPHQLALVGALSTGLGLVSAAVFAASKFGDEFASMTDSVVATAVIPAALAALAVWVVTVVITSSPVISLAGAIPASVVVAATELDLDHGLDRDDDESETLETTEASETPSSSGGRRRFVATAGSALGFSAVAYWFGNQRTTEEETEELPVSTSSPESGGGSGTGSDTGEKQKTTYQDLLDEAESKSLDIDGIPGLVSTFEEFYEVDINTVDPDLKSEDWSVSVTGAVENEIEIDYSELTDMKAEHKHVSLRCVGENLNGDKMDNAVWTGVPASKLLEKANPQGDYVMLRAADDYYEGFPLKALEDKGFIAYGMNGRTLPKGHGKPVRALILGHWGEINVKWLTEIEILKKEKKGYWEKKGWHGTGPVNTVAKLKAENKLDDGKFQIGGHAYAGTRGISKVEVSLDGGDTWKEAELSEALDAEDAWRQWKYEWEPSKKKYEVVVRATDGKGDLQPSEEQRPYPSGATGWVSKTVNTG